MSKADKEKNVAANMQTNQDDAELRFHEALSFIVESANINSGVVTTDEIKNTFQDIITDESRYELIYNYLIASNIRVEGYQPDIRAMAPVEDTPQKDMEQEIPTKNFDKLQSEEESIVNMYLDDAAGFEKRNKESICQNLRKFVNEEVGTLQSGQIQNQLIEQNLDVVIPMIEKYENRGVTKADLIQEGNIGLIEAVIKWRDQQDSHLSLSDEELWNSFDLCVKEEISAALTKALEVQNASNRLGARLSDHANRLDRASVDLTERLGRNPSLEELSEYLKLPMDEVERIMKMSLDALNSDGAE